MICSSGRSSKLALDARRPSRAIFPMMPRYVIEREIPGAGQWNEDQIREASTQSLEVLRGMGAQIQWIHSYVTDDKIYCVYLAPDETLIREHARQPGVPANRISAVRRMIDPVKYAELEFNAWATAGSNFMRRESASFRA